MVFCKDLSYFFEPSLRRRSVSIAKAGAFGLLCGIDQAISHLPVFRTIGDHMLLCFERVEA
jgi:hypothetical protein